MEQAQMIAATPTRCKLRSCVGAAEIEMAAYRSSGETSSTAVCPSIYMTFLPDLGLRLLLSSEYVRVAIPSCRKLLRQTALWARALARLNAGNKKLARIAIIAMTTSNSIKEKARRPRFSKYEFMRNGMVR